MRRFLPRFYVQGFADPEEHGAPAVWIHRAVIGVFQRAPVEPAGSARHFNLVEDQGLLGCEHLERQLAAVEEDAARLFRERLEARVALDAAEREVLATFFALLGVRLSDGFGDLDAAEAGRAYDELLPVLREMGWVLWEAPPPDYFISSNAPFHIAFPRDDGMVQGMGLHAPGAEITLPLTPRLALHATWRRRGELWRTAGEAVLLELNARTLLRAKRFVLAPKPAIPG